MTTMDGYSAATSWVLFGTIVGVGVWYYYPRQQRRPSRSREDTQHAVTGRRKRNEQDDRTGQNRSLTPDPSTGTDPRIATVKTPSRPSSNDNLRKRKAQTQQSAPAPTYAQVVQVEEPDQDEVNTRKWAEGMMQTQKGYDIASTKSKDARVKTVKQSSALHTPVLSSGSSQAGAEADDDLSPAVSPALNRGDVSDMLEPAAPGPSMLRLTAPTKQQKAKVAGQPKEAVIETKKQRQNRKKVEDRRLQREAEERDRKKLEENQRRSAREARGEPAKNGISVAKPPTVSPWTTSSSTSDAPIAPTVNGNQTAPLLDTFDAESLSSSNGGLEHSTGPTSTTSGGAASWDLELPSEEEQMAQAMKQSEDESGWTTVGQPKKQKKKGEASNAEPALTNKTNLQTTKPAINGKPRGFQALDVQYEQRTDADPNDASNWDA